MPGSSPENPPSQDLPCYKLLEENIKKRFTALDLAKIILRHDTKDTGHNNNKKTDEMDLTKR